MQPYFEAVPVDWAEVAGIVLQNADVNFDAEVTTDELTDVLFWEFGVNPNQRERAFVHRSLSDVCTWYQSFRLTQDTLEDCL